MATTARKPKITVKKHGGDDEYSWAVLRDGRPVFTGLSRAQARHYRKEAEKGYSDSGIPAFRGPFGL